MGHGTDKQLEHAEHAQHAAHNPFDRKVAMSMAIVAAALAGVTLLSHRGHTETLRLTTVANIYHTQATDQYNFYQAKNIRSYEFQSNLMMTLMNKSTDVDPVVKANSEKFWIQQVNKYEGKASEPDEKDYWTLMAQYLKSPDKSVKRPKRFADPAKSELSDLLKKAGDLQDKAKKLEHASHELHGHVNWIDYGHLALELGLVLASIAVLTKGRGFWFSGLAVAGLGIVLATIGLIGMLQMETIEEHHAGDHAAEHKQEGGSEKESENKTGGDHKPSAGH